MHNLQGRFRAEGEGTRVELEHRKLENMGPMAHGFEEGWEDVLGWFVRAAG
jgi:hypothetical protein